MRAVDLQAFVALFVVFLSIITHLIGKPFDLTKKKSQMIHQLEFISLACCWLTFWCGLLFFLGTTIPDSVRITASIAIVLINVTFFCYAMVIFAKEFVQDYKAHKEEIKTTDQQDEYDNTHVVPINSGADGDGDSDAIQDDGIKRRILKPKMTINTKIKSIMDQSMQSASGLLQDTERRGRIAHANTQMRVAARRKLKQSKKLQAIPIFDKTKNKRI